LRERMYEIAPSLSRYDIVEPSSMGAVGLKFVGDANKGNKSTGGSLTKVIEDFYLTDVISRRCFLKRKLLI
jgi:NADH dehydrogenase (ubiquinone) Fe-S protein 1